MSRKAPRAISDPVSTQTRHHFCRANIFEVFARLDVLQPRCRVPNACASPLLAANSPADAMRGPIPAITLQSPSWEFAATQLMCSPVRLAGTSRRTVDVPSLPVASSLLHTCAPAPSPTPPLLIQWNGLWSGPGRFSVVADLRNPHRTHPHAWRVRRASLTPSSATVRVRACAPELERPGTVPILLAPLRQNSTGFVALWTSAAEGARGTNYFAGRVCGR
ncbi:hypothetical protein B0H17DRAFT_1334240 [Mycena rosella]|uniref:Uncharacterized protein n=1 Tax=Mycena rosella TaxID=1033263 RepID=A0AAD7D7K7_MYCRO|nr:hypothetical protein B0H17DRAFT_1334240 [Mycena rosella]